jgi:hypothetical protein
VGGEELITLQAKGLLAWLPSRLGLQLEAGDVQVVFVMRTRRSTRSVTRTLGPENLTAYQRLGNSGGASRGQRSQERDNDMDDGRE